MEQQRLRVIQYVLQSQIEERKQLSIIRLLVAQFLLGCTENPRKLLQGILTASGLANIQLPEE